jgi:Ca2+-binding RTX toxin-like protein
MATIYGLAKGHATLYDTAENDTIIAAGGNNTIFDLAGNDTISAGSLGGNLILAGTQYDGVARAVTVRVNGLNNTIDGGDANFTVTGYSGDTTVSLGDGQNTITLGGQNNDITVGWGRNVITAGSGHDRVTVVGGDLEGNQKSVGVVNVTFSGTNNSFYNDTWTTSNLAFPMPILTTINGGSGLGTYDLFGGGTVLTGGTGNVISASAGNYHIVAGSGNDTVYLNPNVFYDLPTTATVRLAGTGNVVDGFADNATIIGGLGNTTVRLGEDTWTNGMYVVNLGGTHNSVASALGHGRIDAGGSDATISLMDSNFQLFVRGTADFIALHDGSDGTIEDNASGLSIAVTGATNETIDNFGFNRGDVVTVGLSDFGVPSPFASAADVYAAVQNTAAGAVLSFNGGADTITFAGLTKAQLSTANFAV